MNKDPVELEEGEFFDESFEFKQITWKVSNALSLPDSVDYKVQSKTFTFAGATWRLVMYPYAYGQTKYNTEGYINLFIRRLNSRFPKHSVFYKFSIKTVDGKESDSFSATVNFNSPTSASSGCAVRYLEKSKFMDKKDNIVQNEVLTIFCQIRTKKNAVIDRCVQTESSTSLIDGSLEQTSEQEPESSASIYEGCNSTSKDPLALSAVKALEDLKELYLKQEVCDVIFKVKGQEFPAHRAILSARCLVFASTFRNDMKEKATGVVEIEDCDPTSFSDFLCFLYCGNVDNLTTENVFSLFTTADKYDVQDLRSQCMEFIKNNLSVRSFCNTVTLALQYSEEELLQLSIDFLAKNLQDVIMTADWQKLLIESPIQCNELMIKALKSNKN